MSNQKKWAVLLLLLMIVSGMIYYAVRGLSSKQITTDIEIIPSDRAFDIVALTADSAGMDLDSDLKLLCNAPTKLADIKSSLSIMPNKPYDVEKVSDKEFLIRFNEKLNPNSLYKVSLKNESDRELSWAFQTKKEFKIIRSLPRNKGTYVPVNSGIEIQFSYPDIEPIDDFFEISPSVEGRFEYHKDTAVFVHKGLEENTLYTVKLKPGIALKNSTEKTSEEYIFQFKTEKKRDKFNSFFRFTDEMYNVTSKTTPYLEVFASETFKDKDLNVEVYKYVQKKNFIDNIIRIDNSKLNWDEENDIKLSLDSNMFNKVVEFETVLMRADKNYWNNTFIELPEPLSEGEYLINVMYDNENYQTHIQVNDLAVYAMIAEKESLLWINDSITGKPVEAAKVLVVGEKEEYLTDEQGIVVIEDSVLIEEPFRRAYFQIDKEGSPSFLVRVKPDYYNYQTFYFDDYHGKMENNSYWSYLYMDRGLYLPSDKINVWGLVKSRDSLDIPKKGVLYLSSSDYGEKSIEVQRKEVLLNEFGCYDESFKYTNLIPGRYSLELKIDDKLISRKYFDISKYTKPSYRVKAEFDRENVFAWETAKLKINASFFEGSPVSGLKLDYNYYEYNGGERSGALSCDKNGYVEFDYNPNMMVSEWRPQSVNINIRNSEAEDEEVWTEERIMVFPKDIMINTNSQISDDKSTASIKIKTNKINLNKKIGEDDIWRYEDSFKGDAIDIDLKVNIHERYYEKHEAGEYYDFINKTIHKRYNYTEKTKLIKELDIKTNSGAYSFDFPIEDEKNYFIQILGEDTRGNTVVESMYVNAYNYYDWYLRDEYNIEEKNITKQNYRLDEQINLKLKYKNEDADNTDKDSMLFLILQDGLKSYKLSNDVEISFSFDNELIPNYYIRGVYFDGENIYKAGLKHILYDYTEKQINIDIKADKTEYKPGDTVNLDIVANDLNGKPVNANVNISVVDEAFFAVREQYVDTLQSIYDYRFGTGMLMDFVSYTSIDLYGSGMAEGGEGNSYVLRYDFKDTAIFKTVSTGSDGKASISFVLPDNLTAWRITYQGITKDLYAGNGKLNINVKLPFFVDVIMSDTYMKGDIPHITIRSFGTELDRNDDVSYTGTVFTEGNKRGLSFNKTSKGNEYTNVEIQMLDSKTWSQSLEEGKYTFSVEARSKNFFDGISKEFEVVDSMLEVMKTNYHSLDKSIKIESGKGYTRLHFYNKSSSLYYNALTSLMYSWGERVDQQLSKIITRDILNKSYSINKDSVEYDLSKYQLNDGGIALLPYSDSEPSLSAKIASLASDLFDKNALRGYFYNVINNEESIKEDVLYAYWGLAALEEPVLVDIQRMLNQSNLAIKDELILNIALIELGDTVKAEKWYIELINAHGKRSGISSFININGDKDDILEATSLASILSTKIRMDDRYNLFRYVVQNHTKNILTNLEQLICIVNDVPDREQKVSFKYILNGTEKKVTLLNTETYELLLNTEDANDIKFKDIEGDIKIASSYMSPVKDVIESKDDNIALERKYLQIGNSTEDFEHSSLIKIVLTPEFSETAPDGYYEITDILPSGLRYVKNINTQGKIWYPNDRNGQKITFGYYYRKGMPKDSIVYYSRAVSPGVYTSDYAIIKHYKSDTFGIAEQQTITINE